MQFLKSFVVVMISLLIAGVCQVQAREISMLTEEWVPHYGSELAEKGLTTAIIKAAFRAGGHSSEVEFIPWPRALKKVEAGKSDIVMGVDHGIDREQTYIFSDPICFLELGHMARPGPGLSRYNSLPDLTSYSIKQSIVPESQDEIGQLPETFQRMQTSRRIAFKSIYKKASSA